MVISEIYSEPRHAFLVTSTLGGLLSLMKNKSLIINDHSSNPDHLERFRDWVLIKFHMLLSSLVFLAGLGHLKTKTEECSTPASDISVVNSTMIIASVAVAVAVLMSRDRCTYWHGFLAARAELKLQLQLQHHQ